MHPRIRENSRLALIKIPYPDEAQRFAYSREFLKSFPIDQVEMQQQQLAELTGITYQQISKYEKGIHRVYADIILRLAHILAVDVSFFFEGIEAEHVDSSTAYQNRLLTEMVRNFVGMDLQRQEAFCKVVEALVDHVEAE